MTVSDQELASLAASHDIISVGRLADEIRRQRHGLRTTFVRVLDVSVDAGAARSGESGASASAGEVRITGTPANRAAAIDAVRRAAASASPVLSGFSLADLEEIALRDGGTLRSLLEDLRAAGLELVAEAPFDRLRDPRRSIEEVN